MADFLTRLVERTRGLAPTVDPIVAPLFAPGPNVRARVRNSSASRRPMLSAARVGQEASGQAAARMASARSTGCKARPRSQTSRSSRPASPRTSTSVSLLPPPRYSGAKTGSVGSGTSVSRSQPSFSSVIDWIATPFPLASSSGSAWNAETQQR